MSNLSYIVNNQLAKHKVDDHQVQPVLYTIPKSSKTVIESNNDFYFFVNAFTEGGTANGRIRGTGGGNSFNITPVNLNTKIFKFQMFKGKVTIQNLDADNTLYVEFLRVTPVVSPSVEIIKE